MDLAQPDAVRAPGLGALRRLERVAERGGLARPLAQLLDEDADVHGARPPQAAPGAPDGSGRPLRAMKSGKASSALAPRLTVVV